MTRVEVDEKYGDTAAIQEAADKRYDEILRGVKSTCVVADCSKVGYARRLCEPHYRKFQYRVHKGEITWEELEKSGKVSTVIPDKFRKFQRCEYFRSKGIWGKDGPTN